LDLRNNQITVREILANPAARAVVMHELPEVYNSPLLGFAKGMTLAQVMSFAGKIPEAKQKRILEGLLRA
jgi:hypothetical protein